MNKRSFLSTVVAAAVGAMMALPAAAQNVLDNVKKKGVLVVGVKADYKPYGFRDPSGKIVGIEPDMAADVAKRLGVKLELVAVVSSNRMQFLDQGKIDLMIATMNDKPERRKAVRIVEPLYYASGVNLLAPKSAKFRDWKDVKGRKICMIQGAWYNKNLQQDYGADIVAFKGTSEVYNALKQGNCAAFAYDDTAILAQLLDPEWKDYEMPLKTILEEPWGLAVKHGEESFYKFMSETIADWHRRGTILELEKKWGIQNTAFAQKMHAEFKGKK